MKNNQKACPVKFQRNGGFVIPLIIAIVALLVIGGIGYFLITIKPCAWLHVGYRNTETQLCENFSSCSSVIPKKYILDNDCLTPSATTTPIVGNDRDIHGCIGSAGYSWCAVKNKCLRVWEEKCEATSTAISTSGIKIYSISPSSGPIGTKIILTGNFSEGEYGGPEYATQVVVEKNNGEKAFIELMPSNNATSFIIQDKMCTKNTGGSGLPCPAWMIVSPGTYSIYYENLYLKEISNRVNFTVTATSSACTPNWTCDWGTCTNGYQGMTAVDSNNCGLSPAGVMIACPALARMCQ